MRAAVRRTYGSPEDVLDVREIGRPEPAADELLVRVHSASVNPFDWHVVTGVPYIGRIQGGLRRPKEERSGIDFAGMVEAVGKDVTQFQSGEDVFGGRDGAFAEYVCVPEERAVVTKPADVTFEHAATVPIAAVTALQACVTRADSSRGRRS
jgi:NADPH:quinone reductase-like Zn-dependent oxidoreductase